VSNTKRLTPAECAVIISIDILSKAGTPTTPKKIADFLKEDVQTVRNILERLRKKSSYLFTSFLSRWFCEKKFIFSSKWQRKDT
jgi:DNA-binding MarR family transcriptional regulator